MTTTSTYEPESAVALGMAEEHVPEILVVDDEAHIRGLLQRNLQEAGFKTVGAENGLAALHRIAERRPDVLLLDLSMPKGNGLEVLARIREHSATKSLPVIVLSAVPPAKAQLKTWELGVKHYLQKPVTYDTLVLTVRVALRGAQEKEGIRSESDETVAVDAPEQQSPEAPKPSALDPILALGTIPGHLTFLYGHSGTGKSVMAQSIAHAAAAQEKPVVYFTSDVPRSGRRAHSPMAGTAIEVEAALVSRMDSLGLDTGPMQRDRTFKVAPIDYPTGIPSTMLGERAIDGITKAVEEAPVGRSLIVIDDITALAGIDKGLVLVRLLSYLDGLVDTGTSVVVASQPGALEGRSISNILSISNTFLHLAISDRSRMLIVQKSESDHLTTGMRLKFTVEKGSGLRVVA